ncbi:hypothetical protein GCM10012285_16090 [Streptomyces kronopolitis]|uniref:Integrase n=1 Tax=Streptomyces kronopolitis TaxID=1612435 RepID=A0ABQ2J3F6_9ACTN|nr:hypothetical protein [Streptomyces kronopolitis]GGN39233.1 hypothetical protein GCM10012285_16090 [Streptomyces kronopolitis]
MRGYPTTVFKSVPTTGAISGLTCGYRSGEDQPVTAGPHLAHSAAGGRSPGGEITRAGERAGIEKIRFTGHSPRRGLATSSRLKGHDQIVIAKQGGWAAHSKVLAGYLEVVDQWEDNALIGAL